MLNIQIGSQLFANFGAMFPTTEYTVTAVTADNITAVDADGEVENFPVSNIKEYGTTSANGSQIGVFLLPATVH